MEFMFCNITDIHVLQEQTIEAMDRNRVCSEYWDSRPYSRPQVQIPQTGRPEDATSGNSKTIMSDREQQGRPTPSIGIHTTTLRGLFKKADPEELYSLYNVLRDQTLSEAGQHLVTQLLNQEIHARPR